MARVRGTGHQVSTARLWRRWPAPVSWPKSSIGSGVMLRWRTNKKTNRGSCLSRFGKTFNYEWWWSNCVMDGQWTSTIFERSRRETCGPQSGSCRASYSKNPDAAKTKTSARHAAGKTDGKEPPTADPMPPFPSVGWTTDAKSLPVVSAMTVLGLLLRTGKSHSSDTVTVSQKPLRRGHEFFSVDASTICKWQTTTYFCNPSAGLPRRKHFCWKKKNQKEKTSEPKFQNVLCKNRGNLR